MRRVGILGGTFDPIHFGHLRPAVEVRSALDLDIIRLLPCRVSPLRDEPAAGPEHRLAMLEAAVAGEPDLVVDGRELDRPGPSYTADTLAELRAQYPDDRFYLIMGGDAFAAFDRWDRWQQILASAHVVATYRPGSPPTAPAPVRDAVVDAPERLDDTPSGRICIQPVTQLDISATAIRGLAATGGDLRYLMPESARHHLEEHRLYDE
jgi:nicotinate-nucleotide adenylyltransferase